MDGISFHSRKEAARYEVLRDMHASGLIVDLQLQQSFQIRVQGMLVCRYIADFTYIENGEFIVEDVKGRRTDVYNLKKKLMKAVHNIDIRET